MQMRSDETLEGFLCQNMYNVMVFCIISNYINVSFFIPVKTFIIWPKRAIPSVLVAIFLTWDLFLIALDRDRVGKKVWYCSVMKLIFYPYLKKTKWRG